MIQLGELGGYQERMTLSGTTNAKRKLGSNGTIHDSIVHIKSREVCYFRIFNASKSRKKKEETGRYPKM
jgi:hypothetical protein